MILVDANLLLYAKLSIYPQHDASRRWLDEKLSGDVPVGLPWPSLLAFLRVSTNPRLFQRPLSSEAAWSQVERWLTAPTAWIPCPSDRHLPVLGELIAIDPIHPDRVSDLHLAALAIEHGLVLCSTDRGFSRYPRLRWLNPLC